MKLVATFRDRLQETLDDKKMTARDLAYKSNINEGTISRYLAGKNEPKIHYLYLISKALFVSPVWLMGYDVDKSPNETKDRIASKLENMTDSQLSDVEKFIDTFILDKDTS